MHSAGYVVAARLLMRWYNVEQIDAVWSPSGRAQAICRQTSRVVHFELCFPSAP
jgi:hypothetical protein